MRGLFHRRVLGNGQPGWRPPRAARTCASAAPVPAPAPPPPRVPAVVAAALTSAVLSAVGDVVAQTLGGASLATLDPGRAARLAGFGLCLYGPAQHHWYRLLARAFPAVPGQLAASLPAFAAKARQRRARARAPGAGPAHAARAGRPRGAAVGRAAAGWRLALRTHLSPRPPSLPNAQVAANQLVLGPTVVASVFAWNAAWTGTLAAWPAKVRRDALPTLRKGWAFWIPASTLNFVLVPLRHQVLYMSCCSIVWTTSECGKGADGRAGARGAARPTPGPDVPAAAAAAVLSSASADTAKPAAAAAEQQQTVVVAGAGARR